MMVLSLKRIYRYWMEKYSIPYEQAAGMMTAAKLEDMVIVTEEIRKYSNDGNRDGGGRDADEITMRSISEKINNSWYH